MGSEKRRASLWGCPECGALDPAHLASFGVVYCLNHEEESGRKERPEMVRVSVVDEAWHREQVLAEVVEALRAEAEVCAGLVGAMASSRATAFQAAAEFVASLAAPDTGEGDESDG
jgi:hypothetical protein